MNPFPLTTGVLKLMAECADATVDQRSGFHLFVLVGLFFVVLGPCIAVDFALVMPATIIFGWLGVGDKNSN